MADKEVNIRLNCVGCITFLLIAGITAAIIAGVSVKLFNWIIS